VKFVTPFDYTDGCVLYVRPIMKREPISGLYLQTIKNITIEISEFKELFIYNYVALMKIGMFSISVAI
jgi:hypothetical protein